MSCPRCRHIVEEGQLFCRSCGLSLEAFIAPATSLPISITVASSRATDPLIGHLLDSKYELIERLGEGAMGTVYRARRVHIGDEVAVKVLLQKYVSGDEAIERFRREARAAAVLRHPNLVTIHDFSEASRPGAPSYIVMELAEGMSLRAVLRREGRLAPERSIALMRNICAGVSAAHRRNIIHRDLKPDNVIVLLPQEEGGSEAVKVIDFGIAKLRESDTPSTLTEAGTVMGTPFYMSPEQCRGEPLDHRADIYSLGAVLYEMLGGTPPFTGTTATAIVVKHLTEAPPPLAEELGVPQALEDVCLRALAKGPDERYQSVGELYKALDDALESIKPKIAPLTNQAQFPTVAVQSRVATEGLDLRLETTSVHTGAGTLAGVGSTPSHDLRSLKKFALAGSLTLFVMSVGMGLLARRIGWSMRPPPYDEFAIELIMVGLRDALFGAFLGVVLRETRRAAARWAVSGKDRAGALIVYGATGAAILMAPFVLLRTSLFLLPLTFAVIGIITGLFVCGTRLALKKVMKQSP